jgi:hypothetical protein
VLAQIEGIVKQLSTAGEHEKIAAVIFLLTNDFANSPQANHRKVCLDSLLSLLFLLQLLAWDPVR